MRGKKWQCPACLQTFSRRYNVERHIENMHQETVSTMKPQLTASHCPHCGGKL